MSCAVHRLKIKSHLWFFRLKVKEMISALLKCQEGVLRQSQSKRTSRGQSKGNRLGRHLHAVISDTLCPWSPSSSNSLQRAFGITPWKDMVTLARSQRTMVLHYISNFICFGVLFLLLFKRKKKKKNSLCYTCFEICVQLLLTTVTRFDLSRRRPWSLADPCPCGWGLSRFVAGFGKLTKRSEKDAVSWNVDGCILHSDVVLQDVCGNVHLYLDICYVPFFF